MHEFLLQVSASRLAIQPYSILGVGCPRSGTGYAAKYLQYLGWDIGHEKLLEDGMISWMAAARTRKVPFNYAPLEDHEFDKTFQVVRDPIKVILSIQNTVLNHPSGDAVTKYMDQFIHIPPSGGSLVIASSMYVGWSKLIRAQALPVVKVEELQKVLPSLLKALGQVRAVTGSPPSQTYNSRGGYQLQTWEQLSLRLPEILRHDVEEVAKSQGYRLRSDAMSPRRLVNH